MNNTRFLIGLAWITVVDVSLFFGLHSTSKPKVTKVVAASPQIQTMDARDSVLYISCPNTPLRKIHYSKSITWWRENDVNGKRIIVATDANADSIKYIGAYPSNHQCVIERDMNENSGGNFSRWAP